MAKLHLSLFPNNYIPDTNLADYITDSDTETEYDNEYHDEHDRYCQEDNVSHYEPDEYIGLMQLAFILGSTATKFNNFKLSIQYYLDAIAIDPMSSFIVNLAIIYETKLKQFDLAIKYYKLAIQAGDIIAMYNIADLYKKINDSYNMLSFFEMAADKGDTDSIKELIIYYFNNNDFELFSKYYLKFLNYYKATEDSYYSNEEFDEFLINNSCLTIINKLNEFIDYTHDTSITQYSIDLHHHLCQNDHYTIFKNKISLFTRLNNICECSICYDNKLNIDLHCGHTVCTDCYSRTYNKPCPFCRIDPRTI